MSEIQYTSGYLKKKLLFQGIIMVGLIGIFWFLGEIIADAIIGFEITWLRVSSVSGLITCVGLISSAAIIDWLTDRIYTKFLLGKK
jgi:hypothetical protein